LLAVNSPEGRLSVFAIAPSNPAPVLLNEIPVGLEPVSVRARTDDEVWVVNEVSDSVSIISLARGRVVATLPCVDEPADVVFASGNAFVSCARNAVLRVFDATNRTELATIPLAGNAPRALAVDALGTTVFAAFQFSGNRSTILPASVAPPQPAPWNTNLPAPPKTALIVPASDPRVAFTLLDHDIAAVSTETLSVTTNYSDVGTVLFSLAVRPGTDELWVANTEAFNLVRFEPELKGRFAASRVTRLRAIDGVAEPVDLNPEGTAPTDGLAQPTAIVFTADGASAWVAAFGSDRVARLDAATGSVLARVDMRTSLTDGSRQMRGPRGLALDEANGRLYVLNKLANTLSSISTGDGRVLAETSLSGRPTLPGDAMEGRGFLYDARLSGPGTLSCALCHPDADTDGLAWDLGDPNGEMVTIIGANLAVHDTTPQERTMHPMKGPMVTQTLRGLSATNALHWRADRPTLHGFNPTFRDLMGGSLVSSNHIESLGAYLFSLRHHPNPNRQPDNSLSTSFRGGDATLGRLRFNAHANHCAVCHTGPTGADNNVDDLRNIGGAQSLKTPPLATVYQRAGFSRRAGATNLVGFGLLHDGTGTAESLPTSHFYELDILSGQAFSDVAAYVLSFDTGTAPAVGRSQLVTVDAKTSSTVSAELNLLEGQAAATNCDVAVRGTLCGVSRQFVYDPATLRYRSDIPGEPTWTRAELLAALGTDDALQFLGTVPGQGARFSIDRDGDGIPDRAEAPPALSWTTSPSPRLRWPADGGWSLESTPALAMPWRAATAPRSTTNGFNELPPSVEPVRFFRLRRTW
jgi:DNA-binding beta-propeller fold protein YncE